MALWITGIVIVILMGFFALWLHIKNTMADKYLTPEERKKRDEEIERYIDPM